MQHSHARHIRTLVWAIAALLVASSVRADVNDPFNGSLPTYETSAPTSRELGAGAPSVAALRGAGTYSYPITVPPGRAGMAPKLSLNYSSQGGAFGGLAAGWTMDLPFVELDASAGAGATRWVASGRRLVATPTDTSPTYWPFKGNSSLLAPFRAEVDGSFTRYGYGNSWLGSPVWMAQSTDGRTRYFEINDGYRFYLTRETDFFGNTVAYTWASQSGGLELQKIEYTSNLAASVEAHAMVDFVYQLDANCGSGVPAGAELHRGVVRSPRRLVQIRAFVRDTPTTAYRQVRTFDLGYDAAALSCTGRDGAPTRFLTSISETGYGASVTKVPTITFTYPNKTRGFSRVDGGVAEPVPAKGKHGPGVSGALVKRQDVDGDGVADELTATTLNIPASGSPNGYDTKCGLIVRKGIAGGGLATSTQTWTMPTASWKNGHYPTAGERCTVDGQRFFKTGTYGGCVSVIQGQVSYQFMDWNADGLADLVTNVWTGVGYMPAADVENPSNPFLPWTSPNTGGGGGSGETCEPETAAAEASSSLNKYVLRVWVNNGAALSGWSRSTIDAPWFLSPASGEGDLSASSHPATSLPTLVDIDGDGFLDMVHPEVVDTTTNPPGLAQLNYAKTLTVYRGHGGVAFDAPIAWKKPVYAAPGVGGNGWGTSQDGTSDLHMKTSIAATLRDLDGDGLTDLVVETGGKLYVAWNTGAKFSDTLLDLGIAGPIESYHTDVDSWTWGSNGRVPTAGSRIYTRRLLDIDGDRRPDIVDFPVDVNGVRIGNPKVYFNVGGRFNATPREIAAIEAAKRHYRAKGDGNWVATSDALDVDADGQLDFVTWNADVMYYYSDSNYPAPPRLLSSVQNGRGLTISFDYRSSNNPEAQGPQFSAIRSPNWVVISMKTSPGAGQPDMTTAYRYGAPTYRQRPGEPSMFGGFALRRTIDATPAGAAGGRETVTKYVVRAIDGGSEQIEETIYARESTGLRPISVDSNIWQTFNMFNGLVFVRFPTTTAHRTCLAAHTTSDACKSGGVLDQTVRTFTAWPSGSGSAAKLYLQTNKLRTSSSDPRDSRMETSSYQVRYLSSPYNAWDYRILALVESEQSTVKDGVTWTLSRQTQHVYDDATGLEVETRQYAGVGGPIVPIARWFDRQTGNLLRIWRPTMAAKYLSSQPHVSTSYTYDAYKLYQLSETNEIGQRVTFATDLATGVRTRTLGPNVREVYSPSCSVPGWCTPTGTTYQEEKQILDGLGRVVARVRSFDDASGLYRLVKTDDYSYEDALNRVTEKHLVDEATAKWQITVKVADGAGRVVSSTQLRQLSGAPDAVTTYGYDAAGFLTSMKVPDPTQDTSAQVEYRYLRDSIGRPVKFTRPDNTSLSISYNGLERTVTEGVTDGTASTTKAVYDAYLRLIEVHEINNPSPGATALTRYYYDSADRLVEIDNVDAVTRLTYDLLGRRTSIDRDGRAWKYEYDLDGNVVAEVNPVPAGQLEAEYRSTTEYDFLDRPTKHTPATRGVPEDRRRSLGIGPVSYTYDNGVNAVGRLTAVSQPRTWATGLPDFQSTTYTYDVNGNVVGESRSISPQATVTAGQAPLIAQNVTRTYNAMNQLTRSTWDDAQSWFTTYDARGLPQLVEYAVSPAAPRQTIADYGARSVSGLPKQRGTGSSFAGQARAWTYDILGRPVTDKITVGTAVRLERGYAYYQDGNVKAVTGANYSHTGVLLAQAGSTFTYDAQDRLLTASGASGYSASLTYSASGNIQRATIGGPASVSPRNVDYGYGGSEPQAVTSLINVANATPYAKFTYDESGNMIERQLPFGVPMQLTWDGDDRLREVSGAGATASESYFYDHTGARTWAVSGNTVRFWFAESETSMPLAGGPATRYIHLADASGPLARSERIGTTTPVVELHYGDLNQSLLLALGPGGVVEASFVYGAFGEVVYQFGQADHRRQFNGKENDVASGLRYYGHRSYDPVTLRWVSADPMHLLVPELGMAAPQRLNLYAFSRNNPVRFYDPDGRRDDEAEGVCYSDDEPQVVIDQPPQEETPNKRAPSPKNNDKFGQASRTTNKQGVEAGYLDGDAADGVVWGETAVFKGRDPESGLEVSVLDGSVQLGLQNEAQVTTLHFGQSTENGSYGVDVLSVGGGAGVYNKDGSTGLNGSAMATLAGFEGTATGTSGWLSGWSGTAGLNTGLGGEASIGVRDADGDGSGELCVRVGLSLIIGVTAGFCAENPF